jgi:hypothetical protein
MKSDDLPVGSAACDEADRSEGRPRGIVADGLVVVRPGLFYDDADELDERPGIQEASGDNGQKESCLSPGRCRYRDCPNGTSASQGRRDDEVVAGAREERKERKRHQ